jgi:outer membrane protein with beta-barrel domain
MKKLIFLTVLVILGMTVTNAQTPTFRWGPTAGVNFSGANGDIDDIDSRTGFRAGVVASLEISELFSVQPEVVYSMRGWKEQNLTIKIDYVEVPVMADFEIVDGLSLQGGPIIGFNISAEQVNGMTVDIQDNVESVSFSAAIGAQYELPIGLFFNVRYDTGINNINANDNDFVIRNSNLGLSAGFYIN